MNNPIDIQLINTNGWFDGTNVRVDVDSFGGDVSGYSIIDVDRNCVIARLSVDLVNTLTNLNN
tara:strand:+ start:150 stop:338 length:189 start_codon:yes stop_codon:yes gene_type:complete